MPPPARDAALDRSGLLPSLPEVHRSIHVPPGPGQFWRKLLAFAGPGYLVAVGYMDPGNWATDLAGGSAYGYRLLSVVLASSLMAMLLQALCAKLGIVTGRDLAQACADRYSRPVRIALWLLCEVAIVACDLAEVIGTAIALKLLFGLPLVAGVLLTSADVLLLLTLQRLGFRTLESVVVALLLVIAGCFAVELILSRPDLAAVAGGLVPTARILTDHEMLFVAIGILGATVMPHNLYLHSAIVQTRSFGQDDEAKAEAIRFARLDSTAALTFAFLINAAILILAASTFHARGQTGIADIEQAFHLLSPMLGASMASVLFAVALLASGQNSTVTATLAGQIVMEGFVAIRLRPWVRRLVTRLLAIVPAAAVAVIYGDAGTTRLLILSQVVLSLQLPFAVVPLVRITGDKRVMGRFANGPLLSIVAWGVAALIVGLNLQLLLSLL